MKNLETLPARTVGLIAGQLTVNPSTISFGIVYRTAPTPSTPVGARSAVSGSDSGFTFINNSQTEVDFETEGQSHNRIETTNWSTQALKEYTQYSLVNPDAAEHAYKFIWSSTSIAFYIDGILVLTRTLPTAPAYVLMNHWGINRYSSGGLGTPGTARWLYVSKFSFTSALGTPSAPSGLTGMVT